MRFTRLKLSKFTPYEIFNILHIFHKFHDFGLQHNVEAQLKNKLTKKTKKKQTAIIKDSG